jgi:hypothetical protein
VKMVAKLVWSNWAVLRRQGPIGPDTAFTMTLSLHVHVATTLRVNKNFLAAWDTAQVSAQSCDK